ncbi:flavin reductase family protein [Streptomyces sp. ISL-10]|uniref:flavin reductase family protein n=1 Tax=Streptomyces sp. ISL-10 TaxID=2819172 RepID=UPI001BE97652|nr:flavin reductase family protein [Streptomyces sp. ISL-10]MBT2368696.1 flavin reductase family protein [Streptomyces sp. ISL-10]
MTQRSFRDVLGQFATGVVLVTAETDRGPVGMAANSFTSVSLDPPIVALCMADSSTTWPSARAVGSFAVTILREDHESVCKIFATRGADRFAGGTWGRTPAGHPLLEDGLGWLDCRIDTIHRAGDHELVIAGVVEWSVAGFGRPLVFHSGSYARLADPDEGRKPPQPRR